MAKGIREKSNWYPALEPATSIQPLRTNVIKVAKWK